MSILLDSSILLTEQLAEMKVDTVSIFPKGHVTIIAGEPGIGKTWLMLSIVKSLAEGTYGIGSPLDKYPHGKSLVFAGETGVRLLANRVKLMGGINPIDSCRIISSHQCAKMRIDTMVNTSIGRKNILDAIVEYKPDITFFDTMISFMADGKDESSQVDMSDAIRGLSLIAGETNTAMVLIHHFRKRNSKGDTGFRGMDEVIGSSAFVRLASVVVGVERRNEVRVVRCLKSWWDEFAPFAFTISKNDKGLVYLKQDYSYNKDMSHSPTRLARQLMEHIKETFKDKDFTLIDIIAEFEVSRSTAHEAVSLLIAKNEAFLSNREGQQKFYRLGTPDERQVKLL